jgi:hypothetical protein
MRYFDTTLIVTTPPENEPVTLETVRNFLRVYWFEDDPLISSMITTARMMCEQYTARAFVEQTLQWTVKLDHQERDYTGLGNLAFTNGGFWGPSIRTHDTLELPRCSVQSLVSLTVLDSQGTSVTLTDSTYNLDIALDPARLCIFWNCVAQLESPPVWPIQHIQATFVAAYGDEGIPMPISQAIMILTNYLYMWRGNAKEQAEIPPQVQYLLNPYRIYFTGGTP